MDSREHRRVRMRLPTRLRWSTPFGQKIELAETIDASRSGLLISVKESHASGITVWVTFPYDASLSDGQPEVAARVVRCGEVLEAIRAANARGKVLSENATGKDRSAKPGQLVATLGIADAPATFALAVYFEGRLHLGPNGNVRRDQPERRSSSRRALAIPVRVRLEQVPWFEEAMTIEISAKGLRFRGHREYQPGDQLRIAFEHSASTPWNGEAEFRSRIVHVEPAADSSALDVSVCRVE